MFYLHDTGECAIVKRKCGTIEGANLTPQVPRAIRQMYHDGTRVVFDIFLSGTMNRSDSVIFPTFINSSSLLPTFSKNTACDLCNTFPSKF